MFSINDSLYFLEIIHKRDNNDNRKKSNNNDENDNDNNNNSKNNSDKNYSISKIKKITFRSWKFLIENWFAVFDFFFNFMKAIFDFKNF